MIFFELGCSGQSSTTRFQGLSGGNTSSAEQMASASGVSNWIGLSIAGIFAARMRASRAGSPRTAAGTFVVTGGALPPETTKGVMVRSTSRLPTLPLIW